jgi:hypothetical protein
MVESEASPVCVCLSLSVWLNADVASRTTHTIKKNVLISALIMFAPSLPQASNAGLQLRRAISIRPDGKRLLEKDATAPSTARLRLHCELRSDLKEFQRKNFEPGFALRKFQVMTEICRKFSRYARQEFHLMTESSA